MGVNIAELLPKKELHLADLKNKKIAIDASNALYQFVASIRQPDGTLLMDSRGRVTSHLQGLFTRTTNLMSKGLRLCYVFDGKPPALKLKEQQERATRKLEAETKYQKAVEEENLEAMRKYSKQFSRLTKDMIQESKTLIQALGLPVIEAPSEAEAQAAFMCKTRHVWAVASQDSDSLLFGASRLLRNLTLSQKRRLPSGKHVITFLEEIELNAVLKELNITHDQLIALGILVGTDFNRGGVRGIGPRKALKLLYTYKNNFDELFSTLKTYFDWKEIFTLFKDIPITKEYELLWKKPDQEAIKKLLVDEHEFNEERVQGVLDKLTEEASPSNQKGLGDFL
ncbi:MAG TPA: flap endonuclease-1 [Candidatus Nanoarchaeia archaeon]|nr:flap endonuclease-1 [Candidatus Nanoarchaeia archaeon]